MTGFEIVDHTADWSLRVWGQNFTELLLNAAVGMNSLMLGEETAVSPTITRALTLDAFDRETLLVDWLGELAYFAEMEQLVFPDITLTAVTPSHLEASLRGGRAAELVKHIKAVTYHNLEIVETAVGLETTIVFDV
jgi:SHS2 domain-containing protein